MTKLKPGDKAPYFEGKNQDGRTVALKDYLGKKVALFFYPKDLTPSCTNQACNLRDNENLLKSEGYSIIGISADTEKMHKKFIAKYSLPFPLLADIDKTIIQQYGVWGPKKFMGREFDGIHRISFVIDKDGMIEKIIENVNTKDHASQIMNN
jgi:thioredoxin-dependent peroxiredoxin